MQLIINTGSTSKKYALFKDNKIVLIGHFEMVGNGFAATYTSEHAQPIEEEITEKLYIESLRVMLEKSCELGSLEAWSDISAIGVRVVAPGTSFRKHALIDDQYLEVLSETRPFAPLHITPALKEIEIARDLVSDTPLYAVSDSAFHGTVPDAVAQYSIKYEDAKKFDLQRFGYHGISTSSVVKKLKPLCGDVLPSRVIVCHLGGGASITAIKDGKSIDTSMGFSPASGLHMNTRTGDLDPGAVVCLAQRKGMDLEEIRRYVNREGGLRGITGGVSDMRDILEGNKNGDERSVLALDMYTTRIKKYLGGYIAILGGLDAIVLTATAAERNPEFRSKILDRLEHLGIVVDEEKNTNHPIGENGFINREDASVGIAVISTDELAEMNNIVTALQN